MGLSDRRKQLFHPRTQGAGKTASRSKRVQTQTVPHGNGELEETDNLEFVLPTWPKSPYERLIAGDAIMEDESVDSRSVEEILAVSEGEISALLEECSAAYDRERFDDLLKECKTKVVESLVVPFGLGGVVAHYDKNGGNVDTIHNVREGVYASGRERRRYEERGEYDSAQYHQHGNYVGTNARAKGQPVEDAYAGGEVQGRKNLDHVIAAKEVHDDPGRVLAGLDGTEVANRDSNLKFTNEHINKTKKEKSMDDYIAYRETKVARLQDSIAKLEEKAQRAPLTPNQQKSLEELKRAKEKFDTDGFDKDKAKAADETARKEMDKTINRTYYGSAKFANSVALTGATEGLKMGWQQALGLALTEFFVAIIDEARDAYKNGFSVDDAGFWASLKKRFMRVVRRVVRRWRAALDAFKQGFLSGFLSNFVTVLINCAVRTGKNVVRMIREGIFSLVRAVKILLTRPDGMTWREAAHEATKVIASGVVVVGGIALAEWLDVQIKLVPPLEIVSDILVRVVSGVATGLVAAFAVYAIDKLDLFGAMAANKQKFVMGRFADMLEASFASADAQMQLIQEDLSDIDASLQVATCSAKATSDLYAKICAVGENSAFL